MTFFEILPLVAWSLSGLVALIGIYTFSTNKYRSYRKKKTYTPRQKRRYWKRKARRTKDPGKKRYALNRQKALEKQIKQKKRSH